MKHRKLFALGSVLVAGLVLAVVLTNVSTKRSGHDPAISSRKEGSPPRSTAFFVSIDGLQPALVKSLQRTEAMSQPRGLGWLMEGGMMSSEAAPVMTPITAASHVSTITCTPPSRHGIVSNSFIKNGQKVNGFNESFSPEPLWRAAMRQGKVVLTLGYVGTDGTSENRQPSLSLAYPLDSLLGPSQTLTWTLADLPSAQGWSLPSDLSSLTSRPDLRETSITVTLNPKTLETRTLQVLIVPQADRGAQVYLAESKDLAASPYSSLVTSDPSHPVVDFYFTESHQNSTLKGVKRRVFARTLEAPPGALTLYLSRVSYNQAFPASFRQALDDANLVWPDYGVKDPSISLSEWVEAQSMIDRFLTEVGVRMIPTYNVDIVLFYQPLVDALGHKMQSRLPQPFDPKAKDEVTRAFVRAFTIVDENLSRLFSVPGAEGPFFVMGDHGMDAVQTAINVAPLLPRDHADKVEVFSSGDLLLVYPLQSATDKEAAMQIALNVGDELRKKLEATSVVGQEILGFARKKTDFLTAPATDFTKEWQYGDAAWVFAGTAKHWLQYQPLKQDIVLEPTAYGMHGKSIKSTDMSTLFIAKGAGVPAGEIGPVSLIQAVPTFAKLIGIQPPKDCLGTSLLP